MPSTQFAESVAANVAFWCDHEGLTVPNAWAALDSERENLFRAAAFGLQLEATFLDTAELVLLTYTYVFERGYFPEWIPILEKAIDGCPDDQKALKARLLHQLGSLYRKDRRLEEAQNAHLQEEELGRLMADQSQLASAHLGLARVYFRQRQHATAGRYAEQALSGFQASDAPPELVANAHNISGIVAGARGNHSIAERFLRQAIALFDQAGQPFEAARSRVNLCQTLEAQGQIDETLEMLGQARSVFEALELHLELARLHHTLGTLYFRQGDLDQAEEAFREADSPAMRRSGPVYFQSVTEMNLGNVLLNQGRHVEARAYFLSCVAGYRLVHAKTLLANSLDGLAETLLAAGDRRQAILLYEEALEIVEAIPEDAFASRMEKRFRGLLEELASPRDEEE